MIGKSIASALVVGLFVATSAASARAEGDQGEQLGRVHFPVSCSPAVQQEFDRGVALLHSFWFAAARKAFTGVLAQDPACVMAYWGIGMTLLGNPLAIPPTAQALADGWAALEKARAVGPKTPREAEYIAALSAFYRDAATVDHRTRTLAYEKAMGELAARRPEDREASVFYALALNITALPTDKTYANQLRAAAILEKVFAAEPEHPGVAHYIIHSYDYPPIAARGLDAARRYARIAPSAPHALHMPSHIFTRVGAWQESIESNRASARAALGQRSADEQLHAMDYQVYAYLQTAQDAEARRLRAEAATVTGATAVRNAGPFALAAIDARYALERRAWGEAASLPPRPSRFPYTEAITHFARAIGAARSGDAAAAQKDVERLEAIRDALTQAKVGYWAEQVEIQRRAAAGWVARARGKDDEAVRLLRSAADLEDATEKNAVTPGPILPARELLGDLLLELRRPAEALREYEASIAKEPNRLNGAAGAARAAEHGGDLARARTYHAKVVALGDRADTERPELRQARAFLAR